MQEERERERGVRLAARCCEVTGEDGSTPALCGRNPTWPPPGPAQAQLLKHYARECKKKRGNDLTRGSFNIIHIRLSKHVNSILLYTDF